MPLDRKNGIIVAFKLLDLLLHISDVVKLDLLVFGARQNVDAVQRVPFGLLDNRRVGAKLENALASVVSRVPNAQGEVFAACNNEGLERVPITCSDVRPMLFEFHLLLGGRKVPHSSGSMIRTSNELDRTHRETEVPNASIIVSSKSVLDN